MTQKEHSFIMSLMIKYTGKTIADKKNEIKKVKEMNLFAKEQFYALAKKNLGISIKLYQL